MTKMIHKLQIEKTFKTPSIQFDPDKGILEIEGRSIQNIPRDFYAPILNWIDNYNPKKGVKIMVRIQFYYYNTPSSKCILEILRKLEALHKRGHKVKIRWEYEQGDDDTLNSGETLKGLVDLPFDIVLI